MFTKENTNIEKNITIIKKS